MRNSHVAMPLRLAGGLHHLFRKGAASELGAVYAQEMTDQAEIDALKGYLALAERISHNAKGKALLEALSTAFGKAAELFNTLDADAAMKLAMVAGDVTLVLDDTGTILDAAFDPREFLCEGYLLRRGQPIHFGLARKMWRAPTEEPGGVLWETGTDRRRSFGVKRCGWR
mgnify:CR=1 FL=1